MRRFRLPAALAVCVALIALPAVAAPAPVGDQVSLFNPCLFGTTIGDQPADTAFHVLHGWGFALGEQENIGELRFDLSIDGEEYKGNLVVEVSGDPGEKWMSRRFLYNFPHGLSAGTYTFHAVWSVPAGSLFPGIDCTEVINFTD